MNNAAVVAKLTAGALWDGALDYNRQDVGIREQLGLWAADDSVTYDLGALTALTESADALKSQINEQQTAKKRDAERTTILITAYCCTVAECVEVAAEVATQIKAAAADPRLVALTATKSPEEFLQLLIGYTAEGGVDLLVADCFDNSAAKGTAYALFGPDATAESVTQMLASARAKAAEPAAAPPPKEKKKKQVMLLA